MSIACTVCGLWYHEDARDRLDICPECHARNFAGSHELLVSPAPDTPSARQALEAYVSSAHQLTPRQVQAMARRHATWVADVERRLEDPRP